MVQENQRIQENGMAALYHAAWQGTKVRGMLWFSLLVSLGCLYWGYDLSQTYGLSPGDGGVLRPLAERLAWGGFVGLFGLSFLVGMLVYTHVYINRTWLDESAQMIVFEMIRLWGSARFSVPPQDILGSQHKAGKFETPNHTIDTPFYFVRVRGRRLPLILDGQGKMIHPALAARLLKL